MRNRFTLWICCGLFGAVAGGCSVSDQPPRDFGQFLSSLKWAPLTDQRQAIEGYLQLHGPAPVVQGDQAVFLAQARGEQPPRLVADFNGWGRQPQEFEATAMTPIDDSGWYFSRVELHPQARVEYLIAYREELVPDPFNPRQVQSFARTNSELVMPGYQPPPELEDHPGLAQGRLIESEFVSRHLQGSRKVIVYLPPGYEESGLRYPSIYFADGSAYVRDIRVPHILNYLIARNEIQPVVAVFTDPLNRYQEYRMNQEYRSFVIEELVPGIDKAYRTLQQPRWRAAAGGSRGGLAAADLAYHYPEVFGMCAAIAPAISPNNLDQLILENPRRPVRFFVLGGLYDKRFLPDAHRLRDALEEKGYGLAYLEIPEGHSTLAWRAYIDEIAKAFFPPG